MLEKHLNCHGEVDCVLVTNKGVYNLSDQTKAARFVVRQVTINGVFDSSKRTIEVADVQLYNPSATNAVLQQLLVS